MPPPNGPNPMMAALQASRQQNPVSSSGPMPGGPMPSAPAQSPEMQKMASDIQDIKAAVDKLVEAIAGAYTGKTPGSPDVEESDDDGEGSSKTFDDRPKGA